ncbi:MAG TPA: proline iminopeptidase-family hydrolase [Gaiellaceae bacterium]|jgi:L-proline amide hydrolase|nr:proline iminopeptidase-family hydrolase [Gaiellaceae bacterium]
MIRDGRETWYRVVGDLDAGPTPVVICHGGPGAAHDYLEPVAELAGYGRACVLYDQLGCGRSTHLPDAPAAFWTVQLFKDELVDLTRELGIADRYAVVGQSWGGMLAMEHALDRPPGLRGMVVADSPASIPLWVAEANRLRADLPSEVAATLASHEAAGTTDSQEYEAAVRVYYDRHLCRIPWPDCLERTFAQLAADPTVYHTMNGPSEFHCIGTLKTWDITDRLHEISTPTLLLSGRYDEATPHIVEQIHSRIPGAQWQLFEESSHSPHLEEPEAFLEAVETFLKTIDQPA